MRKRFYRNFGVCKPRKEVSEHRVYVVMMGCICIHDGYCMERKFALFLVLRGVKK